MKIYIAASANAQERLRPIRDSVCALGHVCLSHWLDEKDWVQPQDFRSMSVALKDLSCVSAAELVVLDTIDVSTTGGANVEFGISLAHFSPKEVWRVGPPRSVFHWLVASAFADWDECLKRLGETK